MYDEKWWCKPRQISSERWHTRKEEQGKRDQSVGDKQLLEIWRVRERDEFQVSKLEGERKPQDLTSRLRKLAW